MPVTTPDDVKKEQTAVSSGDISKEEQKEMDDAIKSEKTIVTVLNEARRKLINRRMCGTISIDASFGMSSSSVSLDVEEEDLEELDLSGGYSNNEKDGSSAGDDDKTLEGQLSYSERLAIYSVDKLIKSLEHRSRSYDNVPYREKLSITRAATIAPPMQILNFSLGISITSTVPDIILSRKRRDAENLLLEEANALNADITSELEEKGYKKEHITTAIQAFGERDGQITTETVELKLKSMSLK